MIQELAKIGFADIRKAVKWGSDPISHALMEAGVIDPDEEEDENPISVPAGAYPVSLRPSHLLDDDTAAAIGEVSLTAHGVKIKMHSKLDALDKLARILKLYKSEEDDAAAGAVLELVQKARVRAGIS